MIYVTNVLNSLLLRNDNMKKKELIAILKYWLRPKTLLFKDFEKYVLDGEPILNENTGLYGDNPRRRIFIDRNSDILFVAHIDTVKEPKLKKEVGNRIWASGLDDRLGCGVAERLSEYYGTDLLICDYEESAATSGAYHALKKYNWIAEFDRGGGDAVTYDLDSDEWLKALKKHFNIGFGTFSDLCFMETNACCVNVGIGYQLDHSDDSYMDLNVLNSQLENFNRFYYENNELPYEQDKSYERQSYRSYMYDPHSDLGYYRDYLEDDNDDRYRECEFCGDFGAKQVYQYAICNQCFEMIVNNWMVFDYKNYQESCSEKRINK